VVLNDIQIADYVERCRMIEPFVPAQVRRCEGSGGRGGRVISYGLGSFGYDVRVGTRFRLLQPGLGGVLDPKDFETESMREVEVPPHSPLTVPPHCFALGLSVEYFRIPRDIVTICFGKSTYARCGLIVNVTPFEPEWEGFATMAMHNSTSRPVRVYAGEGLCQLLFLRGEPCRRSYADKEGKYQSAQDLQAPKL